MEPDGGLHVSQCFLVGITFAYDDTFEAERISHVTVRMFLYQYL
jgi:hypothetical protein